MSSQTISSQSGEPSDFAIPAGVRKIPTAMTSPTIKAVAVPSPICRFKFARGSQWEFTIGSKRDSDRKLKGAWTTRPKHSACGSDGLTKTRGAQKAGVGRVVAVTHKRIREPGIV